MRSLFSTSNNPYFNLAAEEYFLKNSKEEMFILYINEPCIVVGKHQNLLSEINLQFVLENNIKLARRISGGGTVYQDLKNLNFCYLNNCENQEQINFKKFTYPVLESLRELGLNVVLSDRNDLTIDAKKVSGNAMHIFKNRVLSHGTLLFNTDLNHLSAALENNSLKYIDKSIKSVRSKVTNISNYLNYTKSIDEFSLHFFQNIIEKSDIYTIKPITESETESINQISKQKFETWEWVYGYSPKYIYRNSFPLSDRMVEFELLVEKGIIRNVISNIDQTENVIYRSAFDILLNAKHDYHQISDLLTEYFVTNNISKFNVPEFCRILF
jgi:lipoate---protein ligase